MAHRKESAYFSVQQHVVATLHTVAHVPAILLFVSNS